MKRQRTDPGHDDARARLAALIQQQAQEAAANGTAQAEAVEFDTPGGDDAPLPAMGAVFEERADEGQNFDDTLAVHEIDWEQTHQGRMLPPGWAKCQNIGEEIFGMFPMKAPIGNQRGQKIPKAYQWKPSDVIQYFEEVKARRLGIVVDLTHTNKYYDKRSEFESQGVKHIKIECRGHGQVPGPLEVNTFHWEMINHMTELNVEWQKEKQVIEQYDRDVREFNARHGGQDAPPEQHPYEKLPLVCRKLVDKRDLVLQQKKAVAVHCTHGYNRTGLMLVHFMMRVCALEKVSVAQAVKGFAECRPPGIYKDDYIQALFDYYHEERLDYGPHATITPLVPAWKPDEGSPEHFAETEDPLLDAEEEEAATEMKHDDNIGEPICEAEKDMYRTHVVQQVRVEYLEKLQAAGVHDPGMKRQLNRAHRIEFPGSQPVSLATSNQHLIQKKRYWFTWKADGTRYMMWLTVSGAYLIDRRFNISRVQSRFPLWHRPVPDFLAAFHTGKLPKGTLHPTRLAFHRNTLLDGEMVVDTYPDGRQVRTFYVYDLMMLNDVNVASCPWKERFMFIKEVVEPRDYEKYLISNPSKKWPHQYQYDREPFRIKIKQFWRLDEVGAVFRNIVPNLRHENDGLILQCYTSAYVPDACDDLLKWKPASHNSVDFMLLPSDDETVTANHNCAIAIAEGQEYFLGVSQMGKVVIAFNIDEQLQPTEEPAKVRFPEGFDPMEYIGIIIECNWDAEARTWCYMRERQKDKTMPNALNTYIKVVSSIYDAISFEDIQEQFVIAYNINYNRVYDKDIQSMHEQAKHAAAKQKKQAQHASRGPPQRQR